MAFNGLAALNCALAPHDVAAFIAEPDPGQGVNMPPTGAVLPAHHDPIIITERAFDDVIAATRRYRVARQDAG